MCWKNEQARKSYMARKISTTTPDEVAAELAVTRHSATNQLAGCVIPAMILYNERMY